MKANVQISAVKKEFKKQGSAAEGKANGQQGWQVFVEGMEGKLRCEMKFRDALRAIRYSFLLAKKLNLQINEVQLAALSLDYKQSKSAVEQAQVAEVATEVAQEVAAEAEACDSASGIGACSDARAQAGSNEVQQGEPSDEKSEAPEEVALSDSPIFKQFCDLEKKHPDALLLFRCGDSYKCYEEDAIKAAEILRLTDIIEDDKFTVASFPYHALDSYLPRLIRAGHRIAICDQLESPKQ